MCSNRSRVWAFVLLWVALFTSQLSSGGHQEPEVDVPDGGEQSVAPIETPRPEIVGPRFESQGNSRVTNDAQIRVDDESCIIAGTVYVWRNFMPSTNGSGPGGLNGTITLESKSCEKWPDALRIVSVELSNGDSSWGPAEFHVRTGESAKDRIVEFSDGPKWSTEQRIRVSVVMGTDEERTDFVFFDVSIQKAQ